MTAAIQVHDLHKNFGTTVALDGLDLEVATGEIHGFLGPNGAGKSTTIRILLGLLRIDSGTATLLGGDPWRDVETLHRRLAYVPGDVALWPNLVSMSKRRSERLSTSSASPIVDGSCESSGCSRRMRSSEMQRFRAIA